MTTETIRFFDREVKIIASKEDAKRLRSLIIRCLGVDQYSLEKRWWDKSTGSYTMELWTTTKQWALTAEECERICAYFQALPGEIRRKEIPEVTRKSREFFESFRPRMLEAGKSEVQS